MLAMIMRHAERGDLASQPELSQVEYDPPAAKSAIKAVRALAEQIAPLLLLHNVKAVRLVSSPFLRCLMTAELLANNIRESFEKVTISIEQGLSEYLRTEWFKEWPMDKLIITKPSRTKYLQGQYEYNPTPGPFPENYGQFSHKIRSSFNRLTGTLQQQECLIMVTHGFVLRDLCQSHKMRFEHQLDYCSYQLERIAHGKRMVIRPLKLDSKL